MRKNIGNSSAIGTIKAGSNVTITGSGTTSSPYSIAASGGGSSNIPVTLTTNNSATVTTLNRYYYFFSTSGGPYTITFPSSPSDGNWFYFGFQSGTPGDVLNVTSSVPVQIANGSDLASGLINAGDAYLCIYSSTATAWLALPIIPPYGIFQQDITGVVLGPTATNISNNDFLRADNSFSSPLSKITTTASTSGSAVVFTVDFTTYSAYWINFNDVSSAAAANILIDASSNGGSSYATTTYQTKRVATATVTSQTTHIAAITTGTDTAIGTVLCWQDSASGTIKFSSNINVPAQTTLQFGVSTGATSAAVNRLRLSLSASSFDAGSISVYPIAKR